MNPSRAHEPITSRTRELLRALEYDRGTSAENWVEFEASIAAQRHAWLLIRARFFIWTLLVGLCGAACGMLLLGHPLEAIGTFALAFSIASLVSLAWSIVFRVESVLSRSLRGWSADRSRWTDDARASKDISDRFWRIASLVVGLGLVVAAVALVFREAPSSAAWFSAAVASLLAGAIVSASARSTERMRARATIEGLTLPVIADAELRERLVERRLRSESARLAALNAEMAKAIRLDELWWRPFLRMQARAEIRRTESRIGVLLEERRILSESQRERGQRPRSTDSLGASPPQREPR